MRARNIKPGFFKNDDLADLSVEARLLFIGCWCYADRDGYFKYKPRRIKAELFPYDSERYDNIEKLLDELRTARYIDYYYVSGQKLTTKPVACRVVNFIKHQNPHKNEKPSEIKPLVDAREITLVVPEMHRTTRADSLNDNRGIMNHEEHTVTSSDESGSQPPPPKVVEKPVFEFPLNKSGETYPFYREDIEQWSKTFPGVDVTYEVGKCLQWNIDHPRRRKTRSGIKGHVSTWLGKAQDKFRGHPPTTRRANRQDCINEIQEIREGIEHATGFNPYEQTEDRDSGGDADQARRALPNVGTQQADSQGGG